MQKVDIAELRRLHRQGARSRNSLYVFDCIPALLDELEALREEVREVQTKVEVMKGEAKQHFADLKHAEFERDECLLESEKLAANLEFVRAEVTDIHEGLCRSRDAAPGMEWAELVQAAESCGSTLSLIADMSTRLNARDRRMRLLGAAEELERSAKTLREDLADMNPPEFASRGKVAPGYCECLQDVADGMEERAAQLRREAENG